MYSKKLWAATAVDGVMLQVRFLRRDRDAVYSKQSLLHLLVNWSQQDRIAAQTLSSLTNHIESILKTHTRIQ